MVLLFSCDSVVLTIVGFGFIYFVLVLRGCSGVCFIGWVRCPRTQISDLCAGNATEDAALPGGAILRFLFGVRVVRLCGFCHELEDSSIVYATIH